MNDRERVPSIANFAGERTPNYRARFCIPVARHAVVVVVVVGVVGQTSQYRRDRVRCTWVNVYRRGSFMVHHAPCKVALYTWYIRVLLLSLSLCFSPPFAR